MSPWGRDRLTDRERLMFALRMAEGLSFRQAGERFGVSSERARQLVKRYCHVTGVPVPRRSRRDPGTQSSQPR
jgi:transposase